MAAAVQVTGWRVGFDKVSHTRALQEHGLSLSDAKTMTDELLGGHTISITVATEG